MMITYSLECILEHLITLVKEDITVINETWLRSQTKKQNEYMDFRSIYTDAAKNAILFVLLDL